MLKVIAIIISIFGVLGTLLPGLPGTPLIVLSALFYGLIAGGEVIGWQLVVGLLLLSLLAEFSEYLSGLVGVKYFGGSKYGLIGAVGGFVVAVIFLGPLGIIFGPLLGAIIVELITGKKLQQAVKVGLGTIVGQLSGSVISLLISLVMISWLLTRIF
ncbi:hypothetical protein JCM15060_14810 [Halanaerobaculum tunisiense]